MTYFDMNLDLTKEDKLMRTEVRKFAIEVMRPAAWEIDKMSAKDAVGPESPVWGVLKQAYELGYHKTAFPEAVGGLGCTPIQNHLIFEELCWGSVGLAGLILLSAWPHLKILASGNQDLIDEFVIPFCKCDDASITGVWAVTEPDHGTDVLAVGEDSFSDPKINAQLIAVPDGDDYILTGQKSSWISGGPIATHGMVNAQVGHDTSLSHGGVFMMPFDLPGVKRGEPLEKIAQRELFQSELFFDDVRVPKRWMFIGPDQYSDKGITGNLAFGNAAMPLFSLGIARAAFDETFQYAKERVVGGKPFIEHWAGKMRIHRIFAQVEAIRAFSRAVWDLTLRTAPPHVPEYSFAAKTFCAETAKEAVDACVQIWAGAGMSKEYYIEKLLRDAQALSIEDGENYALNRFGGNILKDTYPRKKVDQIA